MRIKLIWKRSAYFPKYMSGVSVGLLFIFVLLVILGLIGDMDYFFLMLMVYIFIPMGALIFIILLSSLSKGLNSEFIDIETKPAAQEKYLRIQQGRLRM